MKNVCRFVVVALGITAGLVWRPVSPSSQVVRELSDPEPVCYEVEEYDETCADVMWSKYTALLDEFEADVPCAEDSNAATGNACIAQMVLDFLNLIPPQEVEEECLYLVRYCATDAAGPFLANPQMKLPRLILNTEFQQIGAYVGRLDFDVFNQRHKPLTRDLAQAESTALQDEIRKILKIATAEQNGGARPTRLRINDAQNWFARLGDAAKSLKTALDNIANDNARDAATRDAARARATLVEKWMKDLESKSKLEKFGDLTSPR